MKSAIALVPALMLTLAAAAEPQTTPAARSQTENRLCTGESPYPGDFALSEDQFSLESAMMSLDRLSDIDAKMAETLWLMHNEQSVENAGPLFEGQIEAITISHHNAMQSVKGYLLKQAALSGEGAGRDEAVTAFCDFVMSQYAAD